MTLCIAACWLLAADGARAAAPTARLASPPPAASGASVASGALAASAAPAAAAPAGCTTCHTLPADAACAQCHAEEARILAGPMATRAGERAFAHRALGSEGDVFFNGSCGGCHVTSCRDCHGDDPHAAGAAGEPSHGAADGRPPATASARPHATAGARAPGATRISDEACLRCHQGYFTGWEYHGRAPREDHERYHRGPTADGVPYLKMLPDVHFAQGLGCADCHVIHPEAAGKPGAHGAVRGCRDCHATVSKEVPEHAIGAHLEKMECWACHSAWAAQEYGTFLVRPATPEQREAFAPLPALGDWRRSNALRLQDPPPLGLDARGLVSPIRPEFILLMTDTARGIENRLLAAEWRAFFPHTIRRGTVTCGGCHESPRRFVLEEEKDRIYDLQKDGLPLRSWWDQTGQRVTNGSFFTRERYTTMNRRTPEYVRQYLRQWETLSRPGAPSSKR